MRIEPRRYERDAQRTLAKVVLMCFVAIGAVTYVILRTMGLLPDISMVSGVGTPLAAQPYFAQLPPLASAVNRAKSSVQVTSGPAVDMSAIKLLKRNSRQQTEVLSVKSYLQALEETEAAKQALLQELVARFPQLRGGLIQSVEDVAHAAVRAPVGAFLPITPTQQGDDLAQRAWDSLLGDLEQKMPPYTCIALHTAYLAHLRALKDYVAASVADEARRSSAEGKAESDPVNEKERARIQLKAETNVVNEALRAVCSRYHLAPEFEIKTSPGR